MIEVNGLTKRYGEVTALNDVSFHVEKGKIVGFLGANGAGKTTTMDILSGCIGADHGDVKVAGFDVLSEPVKAKQRMGYLPDVPPIHADMNVEEFVIYAGRLRKIPPSQLKSRVNDVVEQLELGEVRHRLVGNLSKGFRQRVGLAQSIVHNPDVLILDEPTEGLDPNQIVHIRELIKSLAGNHTILLSSHILSEVQNVCEYIVIIHRGRIVQQGTYESLVASLEAGQIFELRVARPEKGDLEKDLMTLGASHVQKLDENGQVFEISLPKQGDDDIVDVIAQRVITDGYGLRGLRQKSKSLEDVFFQLTK